MPKPPPLPAAVLARVMRISVIDGRVLVILAGGFGLASLFMADWLGALVGGLAAGAGMIELHGRRQLRAGEIIGVNWLVRSQIVLLTVIVAYVVYRFFTYDPLPSLEQIEQALASAQRAQGMDPTPLAEMIGMTHEQLLTLAKKSAHSVYLTVGAATVLCQGGLAYYYHRKGPIIARALCKS
ncbi:MAG: hypothetical protein IPP19_01660 [Verrucomicrobia bacterium]|nr:hypothetical protein [Verrucomicrobiota bacterium]